MNLSALIKKGGLVNDATATPATTATQEGDQTVTVAPVATVAVIIKPESQKELSRYEEEKIKDWLVHIEEINLDIITEVINSCHTDIHARRYFLQRAEEIPPINIYDKSRTCGKCINFERIDHPNLGHCSQGCRENIAGLWDNDGRYCEQYQSKT